MSFLIKQLCLSWPDPSEHYTLAELALLREERYILNSKGDATVRASYARTDEKLRFAVKMLTKPHPNSLRLDLGSAGWQVLSRSPQKIRNRVTHPKKKADVTVSDTDFAVVPSALHWANQTLTTNLASALVKAVEEAKRRGLA